MFVVIALVLIVAAMHFIGSRLRKQDAVADELNRKLATHHLRLFGDQNPDPKYWLDAPHYGKDGRK